MTTGLSTRSKTRNSWFSHCGSPIAARLIAIFDSGVPVPVVDSSIPKDSYRTPTEPVAQSLLYWFVERPGVARSAVVELMQRACYFL
jgi:hypothetical protein